MSIIDMPISDNCYYVGNWHFMLATPCTGIGNNVLGMGTVHVALLRSNFHKISV